MEFEMQLLLYACFFSLKHFGHVFAETFWSLRHFSCFSYSSIKTRHVIIYLVLT